MVNYYKLNLKEVFLDLKSSAEGITSSEAKKRLSLHGFNEIVKDKKNTIIKIFFSQFANALILLLLFAFCMSLFLGEYAEAIAILVIVIINSIMGFIQEYRAEKAMEALEELSTPFARVIRDTKEIQIPAKELVIGDVIILEEGDIVPADARIISNNNIEIDESSLTGESVPSKKSLDILSKNVSVADQRNMVFMGTSVSFGDARAIVTATGMNTEFGKIAHSIQSTEETKTPLQVKFEKLAKQISIVASILIIFVLVTGILQGLPFTRMIFFAIALTASTIPSALPIIVTISLSMGANRLAKKNMLIKKLPAAESLGATTIICSDKTGTLTKNEMTITNMYVNNSLVHVSGLGYFPEGKFSYADVKTNHKLDTKDFNLLFKIGYLCNNAKLLLKKNKYHVLGDPTEGSLIVLAKKAKLSESYFKSSFDIVHKFSFDSDRKMMSVICKDKKSGSFESLVKGAPDLLLKKCTKIYINGKISKLTSSEKKRILGVNTSFCKDALRVLGVAYKPLDSTKISNLIKASKLNSLSIDSVESDLIFVGLVGMMDPPREGVKESIEHCHKAGIEVMMITGDHAVTAEAIGQKIGIFKEGDLILTGEDVDLMSDKELSAKISHVRVIARALPIQKSRIVDALKKQGHIVAMTGDGVNDAPALKKADIGIAMGITGTGVSKSVAKAILVDDHFSTIVNAIEEGRNIYDKMIRSAKYLLSCNSGEIFSVFMGVMLFPQSLIMLPLMLLIMNILTDEFPALGLGFESGDPAIMDRPPRNPSESPIGLNMFLSILIFGLIMGIGTLFVFIKYLNINLSLAQTCAFTTLVLFQMFAVLSSRSLYPSWSKLNPFSNMYLFASVFLSILIQVIIIYWAPLQSVFGTVSLSLSQWAVIIAVSSIGFVGMEISKILLNISIKKSN